MVVVLTMADMVLKRGLVCIGEMVIPGSVYINFIVDYSSNIDTSLIQSETFL